MRSRLNSIFIAGCVGLFGPLLSFVLMPWELAHLGTILWPTWLILWFVMGQPETIYHLIFVVSVVTNVLFFSAFGWIVLLLNFKNSLITVGVSVPIYIALYGVTHYAIMTFL